MLTAAAATMDGQSAVNRQKGDSNGGDAHLLPPVSWNLIGFGYVSWKVVDHANVESRPRPTSTERPSKGTICGRKFFTSIFRRQSILRPSVPPKNRLPSLGFGIGGQKKRQHDPPSALLLGTWLRGAKSGFHCEEGDNRAPCIRHIKD